jgi:hypothetical protein
MKKMAFTVNGVARSFGGNPVGPFANVPILR